MAEDESKRDYPFYLKIIGQDRKDLGRKIGNLKAKLYHSPSSGRTGEESVKLFRRLEDSAKPAKPTENLPQTKPLAYNPPHMEKSAEVPTSPLLSRLARMRAEEEVKRTRPLGYNESPIVRNGGPKMNKFHQEASRIAREQLTPRPEEPISPQGAPDANPRHKPPFFPEQMAEAKKVGLDWKPTHSFPDEKQPGK